jgi:hypothetical protein
MGIKGLLVVVDSSEASDSRVELAASLAAEHGAHLVGLYILPLLEPMLATLILRSWDRSIPASDAR